MKILIKSAVRIIEAYAKPSHAYAMPPLCSAGAGNNLTIYRCRSCLVITREMAHVARAVLELMGQLA